MSYKGLIIIDGSQLSTLDTSIPEDLRGGNMSTEQFFELGNSRITECLNGFSLPSTVTFGFEDLYNFSQLLEEDPQRLLQDNFDVIISRLKVLRFTDYDDLTDDQRKLMEENLPCTVQSGDRRKSYADPIVVSIMDGSTIRPYLENEDDFVTLSENLFSELDTNEEGEINTSQMRTALISAYLPINDDILKKHGVEEGEEKLDQSQFAQLLKLILQDIADALALKPFTVQQEDIKVASGGISKQFSEEEGFLDFFTVLFYQQISDDSEEEQSFEQVVKNFLQDNAATYGIPPFDANDEDVVHLYDVVFSDPEYKKKVTDLKKMEVGELGKKMFEKFATELEAKPLLYSD